MSEALGAFGLLDFSPFSLGGRFENYEPFIALIFQFFSGRGESLVTETADTESMDTGARLYLDIGKYSFINRTIKNWNQLPAEGLGTFPFKHKIFRKTIR
jgi:hypothetical protein